MDRIRAADCETVDATLVGHGAIDRPAIELPDAAVQDTSPSAHGAGSAASSAPGAESAPPTVPVGEALRLVLEGTTHHVRFERYSDAVRATGVFETPDGAREPGAGTNRLAEWVDDRELSLGRTVHVDEISPGFAYGLRAPGADAVYDVPGEPDDSLASIAESLEDR